MTDQDAVIVTLLGSCVSGCLYDPVNKVMGMNHFLLSSEIYNNKEPLCLSDAGRYGVHAMELVINKMLELGANRNHIKAKAFGGGNVLSSSMEKGNFLTVGDINVRFIREFLKTEKIPLISSDLGGDWGRSIRFYGGDYSVYVKKIAKMRTSDLAKRDKTHWDNTLKKQTNETYIKLW